jgi:hypothetical protein
MLRSKSFAALVAATTLCLASHAGAQVLYGTEGADNAIFLLDTSSGTSSVWFNTGTLADNDVYAIAANDTDGLVYWSSGSNIVTANYAGTVLNVSPAVAGGGITIIFGGLAWDDTNDILYASNNSNNLYTVDPLTGVITDLGDVADTSNMAGLDWFAGTLYATNDGTGGSLRKIDVGALTSSTVVAYPGGDTDIDGLAVGGDNAYLINDLNTQGIPSYDLGTNTFGTVYNTAYVSAGIFAGGAYSPGLIPEPATIVMLGVATLVLLRRRG